MVKHPQNRAERLKLREEKDKKKRRQKKDEVADVFQEDRDLERLGHGSSGGSN